MAAGNQMAGEKAGSRRAEANEGCIKEVDRRGKMLENRGTVNASGGRQKNWKILGVALKE